MIQKLNFSFSSNLKLSQIFWFQCVKIVRIGSFGVILVDIFPAFSRIRTEYGEILPHFPAFGLNTERYGVSLRIQSECRKMREKCRPECRANQLTCFHTRQPVSIRGTSSVNLTYRISSNKRRTIYRKIKISAVL